MRSASDTRRPRLRRVLARVDFRLALLLAGLTAAFTSALLCGLLVYAVKESFEEQIRAANGLAASVVDALARHADVGTVHPGAAYRVRYADGRERAAGAAWPSPDRIRHDALSDALVADRGDYVVGESGAAGAVVAVAWPLRHFVRERGELATRAAVVVLLGLLGSVGLGVVSARRALRPLRDTTAAIRAIDPRRLADRIPFRGTEDDVDSLATATNEVLARLEWAFGRLSGFSADVAHELRTPVNRVLNTAEVALTTTADVGAKDDALAGIHATAETMRRTIEQLLLLAKGEDGRLRPAHDTVDLGGLVDGLVELYAPAAERLEKHLVAAPATVDVRADRELVERAVVNLIENALHHTTPGATVRVGVEHANGNAVLVVEDSGPGIAVTDRERVFGRFVRLDDARAPGGSGLGLPIARMVARLHEGDLEIGESVLGGAAFRLVLPSARRAT
jgi:signal transduction histidine kinase